MIKFNCAACGNLLQIKEVFAGCKVQCPSCKSELDVPGGGGPPPLPNTVLVEPLPLPPLEPSDVELPMPRPLPDIDDKPIPAVRGYLREGLPAAAVGAAARGLEGGGASDEPWSPAAWQDGTATETARRVEPVFVPMGQRTEVGFRRERGETSGKALGSVVLGIATFIIPVICAIPALILSLLALADIRRKRGQIEGRGLAITGLVLALVGNLSLIPIFMVKAQMHNNANEKRVQKNLEEIGSALNRYHEKKGSLPLACPKTDKGESLLSWRVHILPYLDHAALFNEFHLDEPWDSPHNKALLPRMPEVFASSSRYSDDEPFTTHFQVFTGPDTLFPEGVSKRKGDVADDHAGTFLIAEGRQAVPWTKPDDMPYLRGAGTKLPELGASSKDGFYALMVNGAVRFVNMNKVKEVNVRWGIHPADGWPIYLEGPAAPRGDPPRDGDWKDGKDKVMIAPAMDFAPPDFGLPAAGGPKPGGPFGGPGVPIAPPPFPKFAEELK